MKLHRSLALLMTLLICTAALAFPAPTAQSQTTGKV